MASNHPGIIPYMQAIPVVGWAIATLVLPLTETNSGALDAQVRIVICQIWVRMREWEWFTHCHDDCIYIYISSKKSCFRSENRNPLNSSTLPQPGATPRKRHSKISGLPTLFSKRRFGQISHEALGDCSHVATRDLALHLRSRREGLKTSKIATSRT